jgi:heme o synthase
MRETLALLYTVGKLRIGFAIMLCAVVGVAVMPTQTLQPWQIAVLAVAVLLSSASAGAFNHLVERDLDARMKRTRRRPFVTGRLKATPLWWIGVILLLVLAVASAAWATNAVAALYVFLGAFVYGVIYTVWLKRRTWFNIVIGGLAGSFAILAGAAAVDPVLSPAAIALAVTLFFWTPPHFWSLAFVYRDDYARAGVPMLPAVMAARPAAYVILGHTLMLFAVSLVPVFYGLGPVYLIGALIGGGYFLLTSWRLARHPDVPHAMANFRASLVQLILLLSAAMVDAWW